MPMHDWTRVTAGVFHHFHHEWISAIANALNSGMLPRDYYALAEQVAGGLIPDVLALERASTGSADDSAWRSGTDGSGGVALAEHPPQVRYTLEAELQAYARKASHVAVFHSTGDRVVAYVEVVSPGNKHSEAAMLRFLRKLETAIARGCHLLVIDPHPPTPRDPLGVHQRFWTEFVGELDSPGVTEDQPLGLMSYRADLPSSAYFSPVAVGDRLPVMPLFYDPDCYVNVPLEGTYEAAWCNVPARWREVITGE